MAVQLLVVTRTAQVHDFSASLLLLHSQVVGHHCEKLSDERNVNILIQYSLWNKLRLHLTIYSSSSCDGFLRTVVPASLPTNHSNTEIRGESAC